MERPIGILLQRDPEIQVPGPNDLCRIGTIASILRYVTMPDDTHIIVCQGQQRFRIAEYLRIDPFPVARILRIDESDECDASDAPDTEVEGRFIQLKERALEVLQFLPQASDELVKAIGSVSAAGSLADLIAGVMEIKVAERQAVLEAVDLVKRLEVLKISRKIDERTKASIDERQREFLLREQLKSIQTELGEGETSNSGERGSAQGGRRCTNAR